MRAVASACSVALGSLYNYFPSKDDLLIATIESVWEEIFQLHGMKSKSGFTAFVEQLFQRVLAGSQRYPNFFSMHSFSFASGANTKARNTMMKYFGQIKQAMLESIDQDEAIKADIFTEDFTKQDLIDFCLNNLLQHLMQQRTNCKTLIEIIRRIVY